MSWQDLAFTFAAAVRPRIGSQTRRGKRRIRKVIWRGSSGLLILHVAAAKCLLAPPAKKATRRWWSALRGPELHPRTRALYSPPCRLEQHENAPVVKVPKPQNRRWLAGGAGDPRRLPNFFTGYRGCMVTGTPEGATPHPAALSVCSQWPPSKPQPARGTGLQSQPTHV